MTKPTCVTLFSGGGLKAIGAMNAGFKLVGAVEYDETIANVYRQNLGPNVTVGKVEETDPTPYIGITALLASPVCTRMSVANANRGETDVDIIAAEGVCHWLRVTKPRIFVCENVPQYRASVSCKMIETCLSELGYFYTADNINCSDYGVPQSRRRLIIRALLGSMVPALPSPEPHKGWYAAIEDLIPTLPESKFADWQLKRLPNDLFGTVMVGGANTSNTQAAPGVGVSLAGEPTRCVATGGCSRKALLIEGDAAGDRPPTCRTSAEPCFTLKTSSGGRVHRAFLARVGGEGSEIDCAEEMQLPCITAAHGADKYRAFLTDGFNASRAATVRTADDPAMTITSVAMRRPSSTAQAFIVSDQTDGAGKGCGIRQGGEPSATVRANSGGGTAPRAWLSQGRVVSMTPRALGRFMTLPDWYVLPEKKTLASKIIGNGFPCLAAEKILRQLLEVL